ncbi:MAG: 4Fe-4S binding protein [Eubacterium sp.]|nr:4Fe-4S binding protein [Eubacterium sp.]
MDRINERKRIQLLRYIIQLIFLVLLPSVYSSAFAAVKEAAEAVSEGSALTMTPFAKICIFLLVFTIVFGRFFCGYACAFGTVGDIVYALSYRIQKKTGKMIPGIPEKTVKKLQLIKYLILAAVIISVFAGLGDEVNHNSPWTLFSLLISGQFPLADHVAAGIILLLIIAGMAVRSRFFCQFLCPMGAVFSLMPVIRTGRLVRDSGNCIKCCRICKQDCPVTLKLGRDDFREGECIRCNRCITACPRGNIGLSRFPIGAADTGWVIFQAVLLFVVLKFMI